MMADKEVDRLVEIFCSIPGDIAASEPDNPRKLNAELLCRAVKQAGRDCVVLGDWEKSCDYIYENRDKYDVIIVSGSIYLIGRVRERFANDNKKSIAGL
jgi:dihydrofolate synthase/folylpolyglutamate synthase